MESAPPIVAPEGFVEMFVAGVMPTSGGDTLFLHDATRSFFIPIGIGEGEALSIHLRMQRRRFERPLTHDLLDATMRELGGHLDHVQIDALRGGVYVGTIYVRSEGRLIAIDARPSDAVALALGAQAPIYVAQGVIDEAGIPANGKIEQPAAQPGPATAPDPGIADPISL
ncbi:MAG: bifunctional nuclease family protein [Pseudomonadota bacterium]